MKTKLTKAVGTLAIVFMILFLLLQEATACPSRLRCSNFTNMDKRNDCNYIWSQTSGAERQEAVCILWDQEYGFPGYNHSVYPNAESNFTFSHKEIETSRFILFFKIIIFLLFNYILFSILTKTSFVRRCLPAG
ncbi:MAG: hypothetical protein AABX23_04380 [Nanoarchaeota archaeon]